uniref:Uncharacterized protein n=1 Tax=Arundo donax TaxID=35708 RepID=A0A0A9AAE4_ARUDO
MIICVLKCLMVFFAGAFDGDLQQNVHFDGSLKLLGMKVKHLRRPLWDVHCSFRPLL